MTDRAHQKRKLSWFIAGTKRQPARPIVVKLEPGDDQIAAEVQGEVVRQFEAARAGSRLRLDLRPQFRRWGSALVKNLAQQIRAARPKQQKDGTPTGGSLASGLRSMLQMKRWGFVLSAGSRAGVRLAVVGIKRAEKLLEDVAVQRLRSEHGSEGMNRELEQTARAAKAAEAAARQERVHGRS